MCAGTTPGFAGVGDAHNSDNGKSRAEGNLRCLDSGAGIAPPPFGGGAFMTACNGGPTQSWAVVEDGDWIRLSDATDAELCLSGMVPANGGVQLLPCSDTAHQRWQFLPRPQAGCSSDAACGVQFCDFFSGTCNPKAWEQKCDDGVDDDDDLLVDCADADCVARPGVCDVELPVFNHSFEIGVHGGDADG